MNKMTYQQYLDSPQWKKLRKKRFALDHNKCQICRREILTTGYYEMMKLYFPELIHTFTNGFNCHHDKYPDTWENDCVENLATVCDKCHKKYHKACKKNPKIRKLKAREIF